MGCLVSTGETQEDADYIWYLSKWYYFAIMVTIYLRKEGKIIGDLVANKAIIV